MVAYLDEALLHDEPALFSGEGVLEPVPQEEGHGHGLVELVGSGPASGGVDTSQLVQHPGLGCRKPLEMLLRASHD